MALEAPGRLVRSRSAAPRGVSQRSGDLNLMGSGRLGLLSVVPQCSYDVGL